MLSALVLNILTAKVLPVVVPPIIAAVRKFVVDKVPASLIPLVLTVGGSLVNVVSTYLGVEGMPADLPMLGSAAWEGALVGLAGVGVHQAWTRGAEWLKAQKAK